MATLLSSLARCVCSVPAVLLATGFIFAVSAGRPESPVPARAVVLVLDNSGSCALPGREELARFARSVGEDGQVAVVVFDSTARLELPLGALADSARRTALAKAIASIDGRGLNTVLNAGLEAAARLLSGMDSVRTERRVILFTDGITDPPKRLSRDSLTRDWQRLISACATAGIRVSAVLPPGSKVDLRSMEALCSSTRGLCVVSSEPAKVVSAVLEVATDEHETRFGPDGTSAASKKAGPWRTMFFLALLLALAAVGAGTAVLLRRRAERRGSRVSSGQKEEMGLAGLADAVSQLRSLAADLGEPGARIRDLAATIEAAGCATFTEQRDAGERMRKLLGEVMSVRDEVEDVLAGIGTDDARARESLEFVDDLLAKVLAVDRIGEMAVDVGSLYDGSLHEPRPERNSAARGTILRVERRGYVTRQKDSTPKVLRFAKVVVSDGSDMKEA